MKSIFSLLFLICFTFSSQAQIFERLADKAANAAERTLEKKVEQKSSKETDKAFDSVFEGNGKNSNTTDKKSTSESNEISSQSSKIPEAVYSFTHKYVMQMESDKYTTNLTYYLAENKNYFGSTVESASTMISVMDMDKQTLFMFTDAGGTKMLMASSLNLDKMVKDNSEDYNAQVEKTGRTKTILGYTCFEYTVTTDDMKGNFWVTQEADIAFPKGFYDMSDKNKNANQAWMADMDGILLEMHITDTSKRKQQTMSMRCIALEKAKFKINSSDYKKFM
ncbi:MAG: hypothetical protein CMC55_07900 [Flavobacteriaceae bacterium]|nr:hypothetical protein [Flavobacteriaceae bacterium]